MPYEENRPRAEAAHHIILEEREQLSVSGVEVKFYNMEVALDEHLETPYKGLYVIGDGSGITHSLSHASASGVYVAREILETV